MKVTKFIHSCLLIEEAGKTILFDPGNYSVGALDINSINSLDYLLITHEHPDHMFIPLIKQILAKFPTLQIITNLSAAAVLGKEGILATTQPNKLIQIEVAPHEKIFGGAVPENVLFRVNNLLTFPGDSFQISSTTKVLALPLQAPWGSLTQSVELATKLKPEVILPIHDWHWKDEARETLYKRLEDYSNALGIKFVRLVTGKEVII